MYMSKLNSFKFSISINNKKNDLETYLSKKSIKENLINIGSQQVSDIVCYSFDTDTYHLFTRPFEFLKLNYIGNIFPNIIFKNVIELWMHDDIRFEHEFFLRIVQSFPLLKSLSICDHAPMSSNVNKQSDNNQLQKIAEYPHLTLLIILKNF